MMNELLEEKLACAIKIPVLSDGAYYFKTPAGVDYEVRFVKKNNNFSSVIIAFGVLNDEFQQEEYGLTNKGEHFRVMHTIASITKHYLNRCPYILNLEFFCEGDNEKKVQQRLLLYTRFLSKTISNSWKINFIGTSGIKLARGLN
jgi:hypothetical protein